MENKHPFFTEHTFDKTYSQLKRSTLDWNAKALITHIINWQEKTEKKTGKPLVCTQSNAVIADELGLPVSTLEKLITRLNKKTDFFKAERKSQVKKSGGYYNSTTKTVDMAELLKFLIADEAAKEKKKEASEQIVDETQATQPEAQESPVIAPEKLPIMQEPSAVLTNTEPTNFYKSKGLEAIGSDQAEGVHATIKHHLSKERAFEIIENLFIDNIVELMEIPVEGVSMRLHVALMNSHMLTQRQLLSCNEWLRDYMEESYPNTKEFFVDYFRDQEAKKAKDAKGSADCLNHYVRP